jgi:succinate dehydrogenase / fumarate reductase membrane anchor subunit
MSPNYGSKRVVVGAHYGLFDWLSQRITAALMALFTLVLIVQVLLPGYAHDGNGERIKDAAGNYQQVGGYDKWAGIFSPQWMRVLTFVVIVALLYHVWVGMRDVLMDYVKSVGMRLVFQVFTIVWLVGCAGWAIQVLWRLS